MRPAAVIICAYGPTPTTRRAIRQARRHLAPGGRVLVVAAHRAAAGRPLAREVDTAGGVLVDAVGRAGIEACLDRAGGGPVVFVHDDVVLADDAVQRLVATWADTGAVSVPYSNETGLPLRPAELRTAAAMRAALRRLAGHPDLGRRPLTEARATCLVAAAGQLRRLAGQSLAVPTTLLLRPAEPFVLAAGAVATHAGECAAARTVTVPQGRDLLVATMIMRDEEDMIAGCLTSLDGLVDRVEILDTGSVDASVAVARAHGATVHTAPWDDDFAAARNRALAHCADAWWVLHIDADERAVCDDPAALRRLLVAAIDDRRAMTVPLHNLDAAGATTTSIRASRLFRPDGVEFVGRLHETPVSTDPARPLDWIATTGLTLHHLGYRPDLMAARGKTGRNVRIAEAAYAARPGPRAALDLARSLSAAGGDRTRIAALLREALPAHPHGRGRAMVLGLLAEVALRAGEVEEALEAGAEALRHAPGDDLAAGVFARASAAMGRPELLLSVPAAPTDVAAEGVISAPRQAAVARAERTSGLLAAGRLDEAYEAAVLLLRDGHGPVVPWSTLARALVGDLGDRGAGMLVTAAGMDDSGRAYAGIATGVGPEATAIVCARVCAGGAVHPEAVKIGLLSAVLSGRDDLVGRLVAHASVLDTEVLAALADSATDRGRGDVAQVLAAAAAAVRPPRFVVTGTGRSGTGWTSRALSALGHPCGHERAFSPWTAALDLQGFQGDSSWLAVPFLADLDEDVVIVHQVRNPLHVLRSLLGIHMLTTPGPYLEFIRAHAPEVLASDDEVERCMAYWVHWNRRVEAFETSSRPYVRLQLEEADDTTLAQLSGLLGGGLDRRAVAERLRGVPDGYNARRRAADVTVADLPGGALRDELLAMAGRYGYEPAGDERGLVAVRA